MHGQGGRAGGRGSLPLGRVALHLYRSVLYFANLLLCSAAILPKERGLRIKKGQQERDKLRTHMVNQTRAPVKAGPFPRQHRL